MYAELEPRSLAAPFVRLCCTMNIAYCRHKNYFLHRTGLLLPNFDWWTKEEGWATAKMSARCALYMGALKIFESPWVRTRLLFSKFLMKYCSDWSCECAYKIEIRSFTPSWDNSDSIQLLKFCRQTLTGGRTDRRHEIARPRFALQCIAR